MEGSKGGVVLENSVEKVQQITTVIPRRIVDQMKGRYREDGWFNDRLRLRIWRTGKSRTEILIEDAFKPAGSVE
jgi:hypothetical protein